METFDYPYGDSDVTRIVDQRIAELAHNMAELIEQRLAEIKEAVAAIDQRTGLTDQDVRMACVNLVMSNIHGDQPINQIVGWTDALAQYVLTGNKPGTEG